MKYEDYVRLTNTNSVGGSGGNMRPRVSYFALKDDGDSSIVRFNVATLDDIKIVSKHTVKTSEGKTRSVQCLRTSPEQSVDVCPLCAAGERVSYRAYIPLLTYEQDENDQTVAIPTLWEQAPRIREILKSFTVDYGDLRDYLFKIVRHGRKGDPATTYTIVPANPAVYKEDIFKKDFSGFENLNFERFVATKTADEMNQFLQDGDFPSRELNSTTSPRDTDVKEIKDIIHLSGCLKPADDDKLTQLKAIIRQKQEMENNKMIVFSTFRHTLNYLREELQDSGFRVGLINGDTPQDERIGLRQRFEKGRDEDGCLDILLFSEVGCEGLDYQFCDCLVNYDIPWNPMKIEQRIGRIDRKGQKAERIAIYNLITKDTIDADIYERCLNRIGIFESAIGQTDEILGDIVQKINEIAADFTLTDKQRQERLEIIADNEIIQQKAKEQLEQDSAELFGIGLSQEQIKVEVENAHSFWLYPTALVRFIQQYLQERLGENNAILGNENNNIRTMRLSSEKRSRLKEDFNALYHQGKVLNIEEKEWKEWLKSNNEPYFTFAFKGEENTGDKKTHFISSRHPLIKQAVQFLNTHDNALAKPVSYFKVSSDVVPAGDYPFAVYSWLYQGCRSDFKLKMICENQALTQHLEKLLEQAQDNDSGSLNIDDHIKNRLEKQQKALYDAEVQDYKEEAQKIIAFKREQLEKSAERKIKIHRNNIQQAKDEKYKKGEQTKIDNLQQQTAEKCQELDTQLQQIALNANAVAFGVITIQPQH